MASFISPDWFIAQQVTQHGEGMVASSEGARLVALQLGNAYFLLCMLGVAIVSSTSEPKVVRKYLVALWLGDIGHVGITCLVLGPARFTDLGTWNALTWGNIGATAFLFVTRTAYFLGLFGQDRIPPRTKKIQ